jgi:response regulator RpfG family c-di-GMP phosphodiesterase
MRYRPKGEGSAADNQGMRMDSPAHARDAALRGALAVDDVDRRVDLPELAAVELFASLPQAALADLARHAQLRTYPAGSTIFEEGEDGDCLHVLRCGAVKVVRPSHDDDVVLDVLGPGKVFGELAVLNSSPRTATLVALADSVTVVVDKVGFDHVLDRHPTAVREMLGTVARSLTFAKEELARHNRALEETIAERTEELRRTHLDIVRRLAQAAEWHDDTTGKHVSRMSKLAYRLALAVGMERERADMLLQASALHDIGKIGIPDRVLLKPGKLDAEEWELMKTHTTIGAQLLSGSNSDVVQMAEQIALTHHERWDGQGYPCGLSGEDIPLESRVCTIADVFDALVSERPYKEAWPVSEALDEIARMSGSAFEPALVSVFLREVARDLPSD